MMPFCSTWTAIKLPLLVAPIRLGLVLSLVWAIPDARAQQSEATWSQQPQIVASMTREEADSPATEEESVAIAWNEGPRPDWIWGSDNDRTYRMIRDFDTSRQTGVLRASCDNVMTIFLNGKRLVSSDNWQETTELDLGQFLRPGSNRLMVEVSNQGGIAGLVLKLALTADTAATDWIVTDKDWRVEDADTGQQGQVRIIGQLGDGPWGAALDQVPLPGSVPRDVFVTQPGFQVERIFTVPRDQLGSWVAIAFDPQGRLVASDQGDQGLSRVTLPAPGSGDAATVEKLSLPITSAQGLLFAFDSLYLSVNGGPGSGLYRAQDTTGDDQWDRVEKLKEFRGGGEHGPHALRLSPDGKSIYVICGNHTDPPTDFDASRLPTNWGEDLLLPRQWDANGHARGRLAPGGWIARTDPEGKQWEIISVGYRNPYDMDFNADGELFAYDADMEWDIGTPWYRPTRVVHATSGSEFGWRSGTGKWPTYYEDSLPPMVDIGPGSPVGVTFGYGTRFPSKYQRALFVCDWTFGTMYALHMQPDGATYAAEKEEFLSRTPLPLTDVAIGPDGAMYFTIGGRGTQSELFRVTYVGEEPTTAIDMTATVDSPDRDLRHELESYHGVNVSADKASMETIWSSLGHQDRFVRYAASVALQWQPVPSWLDRYQKENDPGTRVGATIALARAGTTAHQSTALEGLSKVRWSALAEQQKLAWLRALQLVFLRLGDLDQVAKSAWLQRLDPVYPDASDNVNRELAQVLVYLDSAVVVPRTIVLLQQSSHQDQPDLDDLIARNRGYGGALKAMLANQPDPLQIHYAFVLRNAKQGWTIPLRETYFRWFKTARSWSGGASFQGFLDNIDREAFENATEAERLAVEALGARQPFVPAERPQPNGPGREWSVPAITEAVTGNLKNRDFAQGQRAYAAAGCIVCHRFAGEGGATGPDLTQIAGRFGIKELAEAIVEPNLAISDQYRASQILTVSGQVITGRIVSEDQRQLVVLVDPQDSSKVAIIAQDEIEQRMPAPTSMMPADLIDPLNENEVIDLMAYLLSRGNPRDPMFRAANR
jgi:putative heme-binding domain-containing protein